MTIVNCEDCNEYDKGVLGLQLYIELLETALKEIESVACGEDQIEADGDYNDSDGMKWIYDRIQTLEREKKT